MPRERGKQAAETRAAQLEYEAAPMHEKPLAADLARRHGLHRSTIIRAAWFKARPYNKKESKQ